MAVALAEAAALIVTFTISSHPETKPKTHMHYRNGREAKNGDKIVRLSHDGGKVEAFGVLHSARPDGGNTCNGSIAVVQSAQEYACLCDCIHIDDLAEILAKEGLDKRPEGV